MQIIFVFVHFIAEMASQFSQLFTISDITSWLPSLQNADSIVQKLKETGVETTDDLRYVTEQDLVPMLKPIQARKLVSSWSQLFSPPSKLSVFKIYIASCNCKN
jgi:hypothetical protein